MKKITYSYTSIFHSLEGVLVICLPHPFPQIPHHLPQPPPHPQNPSSAATPQAPASAPRPVQTTSTDSDKPLCLIADSTSPTLLAEPAPPPTPPHRSHRATSPTLLAEPASPLMPPHRCRSLNLLLPSDATSPTLVAGSPSSSTPLAGSALPPWLPHAMV